MTLALRSLSFSCASDILSAMVALDDTDDLFVLRPPVELDSTGGLCCLVDVVDDGGSGVADSPAAIARTDSFCGAARTWSPMPSCVKVRAVVGLETTFTGDVANVAVPARDELRFRPLRPWLLLSSWPVVSVAWESAKWAGIGVEPTEPAAEADVLVLPRRVLPPNEDEGSSEELISAGGAGAPGDGDVMWCRM